MTTNTDPVLALAELVGAAGLMLSEIDTCGHPVDPAYRATLHYAWTNGQAALASAPPSATVGDAWKNAVLDALASTGMDAAPDESPHSVLNRIIRWHTDVATDPALAQQRAAPSGEAVAWAAMSAAGSRVVSISLERDEYVGHVVPLYTAPQQPAAIPRLANCGKYTATDNNGQHYYLNHANTWQTFQGQQPAPHPAITHCDNCGCDWLDNGLNPIGCPYCKQPAGVDEAMVERAVRAAERFSDEGQITFEGMRAALTAALAAQQQGGAE